MPVISFTVDSALLRELGERLVGKPHIALAELVKNSYDADATQVVVRFQQDGIEVIDNGHGMDFEAFRDFWMRIGTVHKQKGRLSPTLKRPLTGSKGVGRLAVQFLAKKLQLHTVGQDHTSRELVAKVDWAAAVRAGELTEATADYETVVRTSVFPGGSRHGTRIVLTGLNQKWPPDALRPLANEIWPLQPPFRSNPELTSDRQKAFDVQLESPHEEEVRRFHDQMRAVLDLWHARLVGKLLGGGRGRLESTARVHLSFAFAGQSEVTLTYPVPNCKLQAVEFEIRVFHFQYRQPRGIKVEDARRYLKDFGGVHVYDAGFHLPYYGAETDWLGIEMDHSHRLSRSKLLPEALQVAGGLSSLPTNSRLYGVVHVNTSRERDLSGDGPDYLNISVTRDRLVDNKSFQQLTDLVRYAVDFYAMQEAKRALESAEAAQLVAGEKFKRVEDVLVAYRS